MRLGRIFTQAAKGNNPDPGMFRFVENASDPMAGTAAAAPPPFPSSDHGDDGTLFASGWDGGGGNTWPTSDADNTVTGSGLEESSAGFSSSSSSDCEQGAEAGGSYNRDGSVAGGSYRGGAAGSGSGDGWVSTDSGSDGGLENIVGGGSGGGGGGTGGVSPLTPDASACNGVSGQGVAEGEPDFTGGSARQPIVGDEGIEGEGFGVLGEAWRENCHGGEGERPAAHVPEYTSNEYWRNDNCR